MATYSSTIMPERIRVPPLCHVYDNARANTRSTVLPRLRKFQSEYASHRVATSTIMPERIRVPPCCHVYDDARANTRPTVLPRLRRCQSEYASHRVATFTQVLQYCNTRLYNQFKIAFPASESSQEVYRIINSCVK